MFERILVPLDGSPVAEAVMPLVRPLARAPGSSVTLLHVVESRTIAPDAWPRMQDEAAAFLRPAADWFTSAGIAASVRIARGNPAGEILRVAREGSYELIAMGTSGERTLGGFYFGSTAWKVLHQAMAPLLLARPAAGRPAMGEDQSVRRVLVPLDGSPTAEFILPYAESLAAAFHAELYLVRVVPPSLALAPQGAGAYLGSFQDELLREAQDYLDGIVRRIGPRSFKVTSVTLTGPIAAQIVELARKMEDSLVAMASHGRTGVRGLLLGSVAGQVAQHSGDPVLLVRPGGGGTG